MSARVDWVRAGVTVLRAVYATVRETPLRIYQRSDGASCSVVLRESVSRVFEYETASWSSERSGENAPWTDANVVGRSPRKTRDTVPDAVSAGAG